MLDAYHQIVTAFQQHYELGLSGTPTFSQDMYIPPPDLSDSICVGTPAQWRKRKVRQHIPSAPVAEQYHKRNQSRAQRNKKRPTQQKESAVVPSSHPTSPFPTQHNLPSPPITNQPFVRQISPQQPLASNINAGPGSPPQQLYNYHTPPSASFVTTSTTPRSVASHSPSCNSRPMSSSRSRSKSRGRASEQPATDDHKKREPDYEQWSGEPLFCSPTVLHQQAAVDARNTEIALKKKQLQLRRELRELENWDMWVALQAPQPWNTTPNNLPMEIIPPAPPTTMTTSMHLLDPTQGNQPHNGYNSLTTQALSPTTPQRNYEAETSPRPLSQTQVELSPYSLLEGWA